MSKTKLVSHLRTTPKSKQVREEWNKMSRVPKKARKLILKINLSPSDEHLLFQLSRIQLPVRLAYSMAINKVQGQTFRKVGLHLPTAVFPHGQLYAALSSATTEEGVRVKLRETAEQGFHNGIALTKNVKSSFSKSNTRSLLENLPKK